jgi:hypothetical protein
VSRPFRLTGPIVREHPLQTRISKVLTLEIAPAGKVSREGVVWWSVDHANYAGEVPGIRISRGIIAGIPDMFVLHVGRAYMIEVKAEDGQLNDPQRSVAAAVLAAGGRVGVVTDEWQTLACLDQWQIPRKRRVREPSASSAGGPTTRADDEMSRRGRGEIAA